MMNGGLYEESPPPPPLQPTTANTPLSNSNVTSPAAPSGSAPPPATTSASSTSPSSVSSNNNNNNGTNNSGPLHIPAKRLTYDCDAASGGVIRHSHHTAQPWSYSPVAENHHASAAATAFEPAAGLNHHQYAASGAPTYYNLATDPTSGRDTRKAGSLAFWSPAASATGSGSSPEYKYNPAAASSAGGGGGVDPSVSSCHQTSFSQSWCNYSPYAASRHHAHVDSHHHQPPVPYLTPADDRGRAVAAAAAMAAAENFPHDGYGLRNYGGPEPVPSTPYPPPGKKEQKTYF
uniref:(California timema) hypothetical protein n=1 Tax=Timema californicum TaxID=61474 RepID=A0A7R9IXI7_TIMCA|nr:unnamed protein product [Timema californicum]